MGSVSAIEAMLAMWRGALLALGFVLSCVGVALMVPAALVFLAGDWLRKEGRK